MWCAGHCPSCPQSGRRRTAL